MERMKYILQLRQAKMNAVLLWPYFRHVKVIEVYFALAKITATN